MKKINKKYYDEGCRIWEARSEKELEEFQEEMHHLYWESDFDDYDWEYFMEWVADSAYYNDGCRAKSISEAYFVISEAMSIEEANEWLEERIDEEMLGAVA